MTHSSATPCPPVNTFISLIMYGIHLVTSMVSNRQIAPAIMVRGVIASCTPFTTDPQTRSASLPRYIKRTSTIRNAAKGNDLVVGIAFMPNGGMVAHTRNIMGKRHMITSIAFPHGPTPSSWTAQAQESHSARDTQVYGQSYPRVEFSQTYCESSSKSIASMSWASSSSRRGRACGSVMMAGRRRSFNPEGQINANLNGGNDEKGKRRCLPKDSMMRASSSERKEAEGRSE
mmetsp:Transcript_20812/g.45400  ORF Transcript_20812/g.45400 Transcript_20812/m.45400 type:complete len:231 (-) Transcript_20812:38-730(-)